MSLRIAHAPAPGGLSAPVAAAEVDEALIEAPARRRPWRSLHFLTGDEKIERMSLTLLHHWKDSLRSCPNFLVKVFRFLILYYGEPSARIAFPPNSPVAPSFRQEVDARPKLPRSPEQIRSLLIQISEALSDSTAKEG